MAITERGTQCSRPAEEDGFCFQHSPEDETVDEAVGEAKGGERADAHTTNENREATMSSDGNIDNSEIGEIRAEVKDIAEDVVGYPLSGIISIDRDDEAWKVAVEVVERRSVPDTQDILGRYELTLDGDRTLTGYHRTNRYRRGDTEYDVYTEPGV